VRINKISNYFLDVKSEISKISWTSKDETLRSSLLVFVAVAIAAAFFLVVDLISYKLVNFLLSVA
jgi:preprotein translocase subunit SecE